MEIDGHKKLSFNKILVKRIFCIIVYICYNNVMKHRYSKIYFEKYAAMTLHQYYHINENQIIQSDRPDLRIPYLDMGIEVTQAIKDDIVFSLKKENLYSSYVMNPFDLRELLTMNDIDQQEYFKAIDFSIKRKIEKSKHYECYGNNGLYIFTHCGNLNKEMIEQFFIDHVYQDDFYRYIYLNGIQTLFIYDKVKKEVLEFHYELEDLLAYNQISLLYEENEGNRNKEK